MSRDGFGPSNSYHGQENRREGGQRRDGPSRDNNVRRDEDNCGRCLHLDNDSTASTSCTEFEEFLSLREDRERASRRACQDGGNEAARQSIPPHGDERRDHGDDCRGQRTMFRF